MATEFGAWKIDVNVDGMPQKVATAMGKLAGMIVGAEYTPIAYLGCQEVNGINHAVLAEQVIVTGRDTKNVVMIVFNEKPSDVELTLVSIDRIVEGGAPMGGVAVDVKTDIPAEAKTIWDDAFDGFVGSNVTPFALLSTQMVNGMNYTFVATFETVSVEPSKRVVLVTINDKIKNVQIVDVLANKHQASLGYAFTW